MDPPLVQNTYKVYKTLTRCKQGIYVGGNSALKGFLLVCQLVQLQKQIGYLILINCDRKLAMTCTQWQRVV